MSLPAMRSIKPRSEKRAWPLLSLRDFFIQMWLQNPALAKQKGYKIKCLLSRLQAEVSP